MTALAFPGSSVSIGGYTNELAVVTVTGPCVIVVAVTSVGPNYDGLLTDVLDDMGNPSSLGTAGASFNAATGFWFFPVEDAGDWHVVTNESNPYNASINDGVGQVLVVTTGGSTSPLSFPGSSDPDLQNVLGSFSSGPEIAFLDLDDPLPTGWYLGIATAGLGTSIYLNPDVGAGTHPFYVPADDAWMVSGFSTGSYDGSLTDTGTFSLWDCVRTASLPGQVDDDITLPEGYVSGYLVITVDGSPLNSADDYIEVDPSTGTLTILAAVLPGDVVVTYLASACPTLSSATGPGVLIDWDGTGFGSDLAATSVSEWVIRRGASPELTGGSQAESLTLTVVNTDDRYNPENTGSDLTGLLTDGPRVWVGVNDDGTIAYDAGKTIYGLGVGRVTDISPLPGEGTDHAPFVEIVVEGPLGWYGRTPVTLADSTTRSQYDLRAAVISALAEPDPDLCSEPATLPLSSTDGMALNILDALNRSNGTRHLCKPQSSPDDWYRYTTVRRTSRLDGTSDASLDAASDHVTGSTGWRTSADGVINQQKASVEPIDFPARTLVWQPDVLPITVTDPQTIWLEFGDYVRDAEVEVDSTGSALTAVLTPFGRTAKLVLTSAGTTVIDRLDVAGYQVQRGSIASVVIDDLASQALPRGVRAGSELTGDYLGTLTSARGFAQHIVWRFGDNKYRPTLTVVNWLPDQFALDLYDRIAFTSTQLKVSGRIFEIVGLEHHGEMAALDGDGNPVVLHTVVYTLQESRVQTPTTWFTLDVSELDGSDLLAY